MSAICSSLPILAQIGRSLSTFLQAATHLFRAGIAHRAKPTKRFAWPERGDLAQRFHERSFRKGVRTPTYADVAQPIYTRSVGRWKNYARYLEPCLDILQPALRHFGYV